jgi:hypothetical protein
MLNLGFTELSTCKKNVWNMNMPFFEYKVIPAPTFGKKAKGVKGADGRFANALTEAINLMADEGWEYMQAESLPSIERQGLTRKRREMNQNVLIFKRETSTEITTESIEKPQGFNPFKSFSNKKEPTLSSIEDSKIIDQPLEDEYETPPIDKF